MSELKEDRQIAEEIVPEENQYNYNRELFYSFDREKGYTQKIHYQIEENQTIIRQSWDAAEQRLERAKREVAEGRLSPIGYYMEKALMEVPMLAAYMEISRWRVRRHLNPRIFPKIKPALLEKYATIFEISTEQLKNPDFITPLTPKD